MKTGQMNPDHSSGHVRGHFLGNLRGTFHGSFREESLKVSKQGKSASLRSWGHSWGQLSLLPALRVAQCFLFCTLPEHQELKMGVKTRGHRSSPRIARDRESLYNLLLLQALPWWTKKIHF